MPVLVDLILGIINGTVDFALIMAALSAGLAFIGALSMLGAFGFALKAVVEVVKAIRGVPHKIVRRRYINSDGREIIEEIPYSPTMNMLNVATHTVKEITDGRTQH